MNHLNSTDATWVLVSSGGDAEDVARFSFDLAYAWHSLRVAGVRQIAVVVDDHRMQLLLARRGIPASEVHDVSALTRVFSNLSTDGIVGVLVSGHGNHDAIGTRDPVRSSQLLACTQLVHGASAAVVVLGQCHAGVFRHAASETPLPTVLIGATHLGRSLSLTQVADPGILGQDWAANTFLVHFADWLRQPSDVDGDGRSTVLDAFRYAGVRTVEGLRRRRVRDAADFQRRCLDARAVLDREQDPLKRSLVEHQLSTYLAGLFGPQEPWIEGADLARTIEVS